jgi:hypothetical protein
MSNAPLSYGGSFEIIGPLFHQPHKGRVLMVFSPVLTGNAGKYIGFERFGLTF